MSSLNKIAEKMGVSPEEARTAMEEAAQQAGNPEKIASLLGIGAGDARELMLCRILGDDAGFRAVSSRLNLLEAFQSRGLL